MDIGVIANRYAKALWGYASEQRTEEIVYAEMQHYIAVHLRLPELKEALVNPMMSATAKVDMICSAATLSSSKTISPTFHKFATLVVEHYRDSIMLFIAHSFVALYRAQKGICQVRLTTAVPPSRPTVEHVERLLYTRLDSSVQLQLDTQVDPEILGGFVVEIDDLRLDASVKNRIECIKKQLIENNKRII